MGEAKRRRKLDPSFGKSEKPDLEDIVGGKPYSEWRHKFGYTKKEWERLRPYFRVVPTTHDADCLTHLFLSCTA